MSVKKLREENYGIPIGEVINVEYPEYVISRRRELQKMRTYEKEYQFVEKSSDMKYNPGDLTLVELVRGSGNKELAVVLDRYRVVKRKVVTFLDYMVILMILTGPKKGNVIKRQTVTKMDLLRDGNGTLVSDFIEQAQAANLVKDVELFSEAFKQDLTNTLQEVFKRHNVQFDYVEEVNDT